MVAYYQQKKSLECCDQLKQYLESSSQVNSLLTGTLCIHQLTLAHTLLHSTDTEPLFTEASALSQQISRQSVSFQQLEVTLREAYGSNIEVMCEKATVKATLEKIAQSIEIIYLTMQKRSRHTNITKQASA